MLFPIFVTPVAWMLLRMLGGFCMAGMIMVTESWLNEAASNKTRGQILSFYMITNYFAAGSGQFLLTVGDPSQYQLFSLASILIFACAIAGVVDPREGAGAGTFEANACLDTVSNRTTGRVWRVLLWSDQFQHPWLEPGLRH